MKKCILPFIMSLVWLSGNAQEKIENPKSVFVGIDLTKSLPSFIFPDKYFIKKSVIIEPYVIFSGNNPGKHYTLSGGFAHGTSKIDTTQVLQSQKFQGVYLKMAYENQYKRVPIRFGYGPIISLSGFHGKYTFKGPTFGDYVGNFTDKLNFAFGGETYIALDRQFNNNVIFRLQARTAVAIRMTGNISPDYFPGLGITKGLNSFLISPGFSAQLFFRVH